MAAAVAAQTLFTVPKLVPVMVTEPPVVVSTYCGATAVIVGCNMAVNVPCDNNDDTACFLTTNRTVVPAGTSVCNEQMI